MNINLIPVLPEIFLALMIIVVLLADAFVSEAKKSIATSLTLFTIIVGFIIQILVYQHKTTFSFNNMFLLDQMAYGMKLITYIISLVLVLYVMRYIEDKKLHQGEFYAIFLFALLGMLVMISANNMLVLYVGLELLSLSLYALVALNRDSLKSTEAAMKFFILGALSSGLLLFGISLIYGATNGQLQLDAILRVTYFKQFIENSPILIFGLVFLVAGLVFKLGLVPFHMWIPDVYEGALLPVTAIIGTVTKIAAVVFIIRFLLNGLVMLSWHWSIMLGVLSIMSLFIGNLVAIAQTNLKRMLGYSAIANVAFIGLGLMTVSVEGISGILFYIIIYVIGTLAGFGVLTMLSHGNYECENIDDLKGLSKNHPVYAGILLLVMFSLAGIPPLAGFYAKFKILGALISAGHTKIAVFAVIMSLIGAFIYLRIVKVMYFDETPLDLRTAEVGVVPRAVLVINAFLLILLGILPSQMMDFCIKLVTG